MADASLLRMPAFFVFRRTLLPIAEADATLYEAAQQISGHSRRPEFREACFLASPALVDAIDEGRGGTGATLAAHRYLTRAATRATPFGLFGPTGLGSFSDYEDFRSSPDLQRCVRLPTEWLLALAAAAENDLCIRRQLLFRPNSTLHQAAGQLRFMRRTVNGRTFQFTRVTVPASLELEVLISRTRTGSTLPHMIRILLEEGVLKTDAEAFIERAITEGMLHSELHTSTLGRHPDEAIFAVLKRVAPDHAFTAALSELHQLSRRCEGTKESSKALSMYRKMVSTMRTLLSDAPTSAPHVTVTSHDRVTLPSRLVPHLLEGVGVLHDTCGRSEDADFLRFKAAFVRRYGEGMHSLLEVLDEEHGIGFGHPAPQRKPQISRGHSSTSLTLNDRDVALWRAVSDLDRESVEVPVLDLSRTDIHLLRSPNRLPLPDQAAMAVVLLDQNQRDRHIWLKGVIGPPAGRWIGRFCHGDARIAEAMRALESDRPSGRGVEPLRAEVDFAATPRLANVSQRPCFTAARIPVYHGWGSSKEYRTIPLRNLLVGIERSRIVLYDRRSGQRIIPQRSTAINYRQAGSKISRFICSLQNQECRGVSWHWGALEALCQRLPRVVWRDFIFAPARWQVSSSDIESVRAVVGETSRIRKMRSVFERLSIPRRVKLLQGDNRLLIDRSQDAHLRAALKPLLSRSTAWLAEDLQDDVTARWRDDDGRGYAHELLIPVQLTPQATDQEPARARSVECWPRCKKVFPPGSEWEYQRLYSSPFLIDRLVGRLPSLMEELPELSWYYLRYADPHPHLRLRVHISDGKDRDGVHSTLNSIANGLLRDGLVYSFEYGTYVREVRRYGGTDWISDAEAVFCIDSSIVSALVSAGTARDVRWKLAIRSIDAWFDTLDLSLDRRLELLTSWRDNLLQQLSGGMSSARRTSLKRLNALERELRADVRELLSENSQEDREAQLLRNRRHLVVRRVPAYVALLGEPDRRASSILASHIHMTMNRLMVENDSREEVRAYHLLLRAYRAQLGRQRAKRQGT